jgi:CO/xanthine dehydrogenase FAD-binding subunit
MYELFSKVPEAFATLSKHLAAYVVAEGDKLVQDAQLKHDEFVSHLIQLREKMINI